MAGAFQASAFQTDAVEYAEYRLTAQVGTFDAAGQSAVFTRTYILSADSAAYSLTGSSVSVQDSELLYANPSSYAMTGEDVTFSRTYFLRASAGAFTEAGSSAVLARGLKLSVEASFQGSAFEGNTFDSARARFTLTGFAASGFVAKRIYALSGSFLTAGPAVSLRRTHRRDFDAGVFNFTGLPSGQYPFALDYDLDGQTYVDLLGAGDSYVAASCADAYAGLVGSDTFMNLRG